jgi:hypothetical protein
MQDGTFGRWSPTLLKFADYREEDVLPVVRAVVEPKKSSELCGNSLQLTAVNREYSSPRFAKASTIALPAPGDLYIRCRER